MIYRHEVVTLARWSSLSGNPLDCLTADHGAHRALKALDGLTVEERRDAVAAAEALGMFYADCRRRAARRLLARIGGAA